MYAYCWATGLIGFGEKLPNGALPIARGKGKKFKAWVQVKARLAYDNKTYLVPGIPEAEDDREGIDALIKWCGWLNACQTKQQNEFVEHIYSS
jgi:hypothetical protein